MAKEKWQATDKDIEQIRTMSGYRISTDKIAIILGISKKTLERARKYDARVDDAIEKGREQAGALLHQWAYQSAQRGNVAMQIFLLKTQHGFRETERVELTGADGAPLVPKKELTLDEAIKTMEKYERIRGRVSKKT